MANPSKGDSQLADATGDPLIGQRQANVADPAAITAVTIVLSYTTDDPSVTVDNTIVIADGDGTLVTAEIMIALEELVAELVATNADVAAIRTQLISALDVLEEHGLMTAS